MVKVNFSNFNIITLKQYVTNFNHGYVMALVSRQPFMQNENHQFTVKVFKADRQMVLIKGWFVCDLLLLHK